MKKEGNVRFNLRSIEQILAREDKFIINLFSNLPQQESVHNNDSDDEEMTADVTQAESNGVTKTERATSLQELQKRLDSIKQTKKKLSYKDKLLKKGLKNRIKKKSKQDDRNAQQKLLRASKLTNGHAETPNGTETKTESSETAPEKPIFNKDDVMVYSKIDFANLGKKKEKKPRKDAKQLLKDLQDEKERLKKLEEEGETQKATQIKEKTAWKNALAKAQGEKVKDDPILLKKTVQRQEQKVRSSKKKWQARIEGVEKAKGDRQKKRQDNIDKRKKDKKVHKMKRAVKKGKVIPGY